MCLINFCFILGHFGSIIMFKILFGISEKLFKDLFSVHKILVCIFITLPAFMKSDEVNVTVLEPNTNYTMYNDSYENITILNATDFDIDNKTSDVATEMESTISVTEDSDSSFRNENSRKMFLFLTPDEDICNCDLTSNTCDINCCCDPDCDEEDMQIFSECSHQVLTPDENYCYRKDFIFRNNTVYKMVKDSSSSMFCIVHDNFKHRLRFKDMPILKSHRDLMAVLKFKYSTTYSWNAESENKFESSELRAGSPIYIDVHSNKEKITNRWSLPSSCLSDLCSCKEEVRYLRDFRSSCTYPVPDLRSACGRQDESLSGDHVTDFCVSHSESGPAGTLAELVVHTTRMESNASDEQEPARRSNGLCARRSARRPKRGATACEGVVGSVHFTVEQDGTGGIAAIDTQFRYVDVPYDRRSLTQSYGVTFVWSSGDNVSSPEVFQRSGNPGYQVGLPVLASVNGTDVRGGTTFGLSVLGADPEGFCLSNGRRTVGFGRNLNTGCSLRSRPASFRSCRALRDAVTEILLGASPAVFVGAFGNANSSDPNDWIEVFHEDPLRGKCDDPTCSSDEEGAADSCPVSLGLKVDVVYAAVGTVANPQHKIVGVACRRASPALVDVAACRTQKQCVLRLSTSVSFFDVTLPAVRHRAKIPSVKANLPADFFYPFLYSSDASDLASDLLWLVSSVGCHLARRTLWR